MTDVRFDPPGFDSARFATLIQERGLGGVLITSPENVYYTSGFPALFSSGNPILYGLRNVLPFFVYVTAQGERTLFCWSGAAAGVAYGVDAVETFADLAGAQAALEKHLKTNLRPDMPLAIEPDCPYAIYRLGAQAAARSEIVLATDLMMAARLIKSTQEIAYLEKSVAVVEQTVQDMMGGVHLGMSRATLMRAAKIGMMQNGASGISHVTISFGASNPEVEIDEALQPGKLVTLDLGAIVEGYYSDNRRLMYTADVPAGMAALHQTMCAIVDEVAAALGPEKGFGEIYDLAMNLYDRRRLKPFIPNIGHTIGLQVEEVWIYAANRHLRFQPGMVLNLEMYALHETGELIGDEETYVITETGCRQLTRLPTAIRTVKA